MFLIDNELSIRNIRQKAHCPVDIQLNQFCWAASELEAAGGLRPPPWDGVQMSAADRDGPPGSNPLFRVVLE
jgi:hypothetical protein